MTAVLRRLALAILGPCRRPEPKRLAPTLAICGIEFCGPEPEPYVTITLEALRKARP